MTATPQDAALAHLLLSPNEPGHFYSKLYDGDNLGPPPPHIDSFTKIQSLKGVRLGIFDEYFDDADPEVAQAARTAVASLERKGATVVAIKIPHLREISLSHAAKILSEFAIWWDEKYSSADTTMEANTRLIVALGKTLTANEVLAGERVRTFAMEQLKNLFQNKQLDAIVTPSLGTKVPNIKPSVLPSGESNNSLVSRVMKYVFLANFLGMPALTVPIGKDSNGLPLGLQLMGDNWSEHKVLRIANALDYKMVPPPAEFYVDPLAKWLK